MKTQVLSWLLLFSLPASVALADPGGLKPTASQPAASQPTMTQAPASQPAAA